MNSIAIIIGAYLALNAVVVILWILVNRERTGPGRDQVERDSEI